MSTYLLQYDFNGSNRVTNISTSSENTSVQHVVSPLTAGKQYNFMVITVFKEVNSTGDSILAETVPTKVPLVNVTERSLTSITLEWENVDKGWSYALQINDSDKVVIKDESSYIVSHSVTSLQPGTAYKFSVITMFHKHNSTAYEGLTVTAIDCTSVTWHVTNSSIQGMVEGLFSNATASNVSQTHVSPGGRNVSFTGLYPGATYEVSLVYERYEQCRHSLTISPPDLQARCDYMASGYSVLIVWNKPDGVWTEIEVNVTGKTYTVSEKGEQQISISGFLPAKTYEVSIGSLSGTVRSYEPYVFSCSTDPRGEFEMNILLCGNSISVCFLMLNCNNIFSSLCPVWHCL
uniref:tenascin-N-like n=1 Tax=Monopterus albus TaxID=43700 RepID=UPI0009B4CEC3|nr:tenascin-N-like [Monopterus albus]